MSENVAVRGVPPLPFLMSQALMEFTGVPLGPISVAMLEAGVAMPGLVSQLAGLSAAGSLKYTSGFLRDQWFSVGDRVEYIDVYGVTGTDPKYPEFPIPANIGVIAEAEDTLEGMPELVALYSFSEIRSEAGEETVMYSDATAEFVHPLGAQLLLVVAEFPDGVSLQLGGWNQQSDANTSDEEEWEAQLTKYRDQPISLKLSFPTTLSGTYDNVIYAPVPLAEPWGHSPNGNLMYLQEIARSRGYSRSVTGSAVYPTAPIPTTEVLMGYLEPEHCPTFTQYVYARNTNAQVIGHITTSGEYWQIPASDVTPPPATGPVTCNFEGYWGMHGYGAITPTTAYNGTIGPTNDQHVGDTTFYLTVDAVNNRITITDLGCDWRSHVTGEGDGIPPGVRAHIAFVEPRMAPIATQTWEGNNGDTLFTLELNTAGEFWCTPHASNASPLFAFGFADIPGMGWDINPIT